MNATETEIYLIDQNRGLNQTPPDTVGSTISFFSNRKRNTTIPHPKDQHGPYLFLSHKPFIYIIKTITEENKCFVCGNRHLDPGNC